MNNIKIPKQLFIWSVSAIVVLVNIFVFFTPLVHALGELRKSNIANTQKIASLKNTEAQKELLKEKDKFYRNEFFGISEKLPSYLAPEQFISGLKDTALENKLELTDISFTKPEVCDFADLKPNYPVLGPLAQQADSIISGLFVNYEDKGTKATPGELQVSNIPDEKAIKVDVNYTFSGNYDQVKGFINSIESNLSNLNNIVVDNVSMQPSKEDGTISGQMVISLFGFKDSKVPVFNLWTQDLQRGKGNLFGKGSSERYNPNSTATSDFDIALNPYTSDLPTVILRKHGTFTNTVFGDAKGIEQVDLQIMKKDGKVFYRFKTAAMSYPLNYSYVQFTPVVSDNVFVKVYSRPRVSSADNAGINLTITKPADLNVTVQVAGDDQVKPRVTYKIK